MTTLDIIDRPAPPAFMLDLQEEARANVDACRADGTRRAYRRDWRDFTTWCTVAAVGSLPASPDTVALYITDLCRRGLSASTINGRLAAIQFAHETAGHDTPTRAAVVKRTHEGLRRRIGTAPCGKAPAMTADILVMVDTLPDTLKGARDRAVLLLGFAGAFRRAELVALNVEDVQECPEGLRVMIRRGKTDQEGKGRVVGIPRASRSDACPVAAFLTWCTMAGITSGAVFRGVDRHGRLSPSRLSGRAVADVVKACAAAAGLNPALFSGHSLRAGLATSAAAAGVSERAIMQQTGHKSERMVRRYIRDGNLFRENAAGAVL